MKIKGIALMLTLLMLAPLVMLACGGKGDGAVTETKGTQTTGTGDSTPGDDDNDDPKKPLQEQPESVVVGKARVQLLSDTLVRIELQDNNKFEDRASFSVTKRTGWEKVEYTKAEEGSNTVITTANYKVYIPTNTARVLKDAYITDKDGKELWRFETLTNSNVYLPSASDELSSWYFADSPRVIPSENGYTIAEEGYENDNGWDISQTATDLFVFLPGGDYKTFTSDYVELTGQSEMITLNLFGYWDSRYYEYNATTALQQIKDYQKRGYSIDLLVIDTDWRDASSGIGYNINKTLFPNMSKFLEDAHELGVSIYFNDHPEPVQGTTSALDESEMEYRTKNLTLMLSLGLDYWWYDRNWSVALKSVADGISVYASGMYVFQWITKEYYDGIAEDLDTYAKRALIMANVDGIANGTVTYAPEIAAHKYSIQWTGDIATSAESLNDEIYNLIYGGVEMGIPYMSSDIGGHNTADVTNDMYVRWMQYGALSTICRVHCTKPYSRMPWLFGATAEAVTKEYVGMRYRLLPLYYNLSHENYMTGLPIMRRLDINYPKYQEASANDQYMLGDYIIAAPISGYKESYNFENAQFTHDGQPGLKAEYFKNNNLSGSPAVTSVDSNINFNWTTGGPSNIGLSDNFSIRWTGSVTIGDKDAFIQAYADDGVRVWIDGKLEIDGWSVYDVYLTNSTILKAGSTHTIKVEYAELGGNAHVYIKYLTKLDDSRNVFLPDGRWMDVWTGKSYVGPCTINVTHELETSPIFVRQGAIIALAENMSNTAEKNWSNMALDIYPSKDYTAKTTIYEDDAETVAYKDGKYRTTDITMSYTDALTVNIEKAKGSFESEFRAFTERNFTIRVHAREDFGKITKITLNGKEVEATVYKKSADASPFAFTGSALDSDIYEIVFKTDIGNANEIKVYFEHPVDDGINTAYDKTSVNFKATATKITKNPLNISEKSSLDWALFGISNADSVLMKKNGAGLIGELSSYGNRFSFTDNYQISWSDGDKTTSGKSTNGPVSKNDFRLTLKTVEGKAVYTLYLGGYKSVANITIRDRAGNAQTLTFGDINTNFYRTITIECDSAEASEIYIDYSILCGDNITFSAVSVNNG